MGDLYLNALPLTVEAPSSAVVARAWPRDDAIDADLRERRGEQFQHYPFRELTYVWAKPGGALPEDCRTRGHEVTLGELPAAVLASALRDAAVADLLGKGFELRPGALNRPARVSRRARNLAEGVVRELPDGVGAFAALALKGTPLSATDLSQATSLLSWTSGLSTLLTSRSPNWLSEVLIWRASVSVGITAPAARAMESRGSAMPAGSTVVTRAARWRFGLAAVTVCRRASCRTPRRISSRATSPR